MEKKLKVLSEIAAALNGEGILWALGASAMLYLNGIIGEFHDIDIMVAREDIGRAKALLCGMGRLRERESNPQYKTEHFLEYEIGGVELDVMAGFVIVKDGISYPQSFDGGHIEKHVQLRGQRIPLQYLSDWERYYELMGRPQKAALCRRG